jgi:hypothetical protein
MVALVFQEVATVPGAVVFDAAEPVILLIYVLGSVILLGGAPTLGHPGHVHPSRDHHAAAGYSSQREEAGHLRN